MATKSRKTAGRSKGKPQQSSIATERPVFRLPDFSAELLRHFGVNAKDYEDVAKFRNLKAEERVKAARKVIEDIIIEAKLDPDARVAIAISESETLLNGYSTLDTPHREEIRNLIDSITSYLRDPSRKRPLNALMLAAPGAGKSHFIEQLALAMKADHVQAVTFNMATMQSTDDMAQPVDELRNLKVNDRFPLLFLDEFDSDPSRYAGLLPLLWDGELHIGHRNLRLGKAVIVLAGSNPDLPKAMDYSGKMRLDGPTAEEFVPTGKLIDLLSRINGGVIDIPDLDLRSAERDRRIDKVCIAVALLKRRFPNLAHVPRSFLRFIALTKFRYGVRSIAHLIDVIQRDAVQTDTLKGDMLGLPIDSEENLQQSSLKLHLLDKDQGFGIVIRWKDFSKDKAVIDLKGADLPIFSSYLSILS